MMYNYASWSQAINNLLSKTSKLFIFFYCSVQPCQCIQPNSVSALTCCPSMENWQDAWMIKKKKSKTNPSFSPLSAMLHVMLHLACVTCQITCEFCDSSFGTGWIRWCHEPDVVLPQSHLVWPLDMHRIPSQTVSWWQKLAVDVRLHGSGAAYVHNGQKY